MNTGSAHLETEGDRALRQYLLDLINASWTTQAIATAVELRIPDLLAARPRDIEDLARASSCHTRSLARLTSALASLHLVEQCGDGTIALTAAGALLRTDSDDSLAWWSLLSGRSLWTSWASLADSIRTGQSARRRAGGTDDFAAYVRDRAASEAFNRAMSNLTRPIAESIVEAFDFAGVDRLVDVGGGHGRLVGTILNAYPESRGIVFDLEHAISGAADELTRMGVTERCELVAGSFFDEIPAGSDVYLLKSVLHDWDDEHCAVILRQCARAMRSKSDKTARLLVIERIRPDRFAPTSRDRSIARSDLNMLVCLGGRERTKGEYRSLFEAAGLRLVRVVDLPNEFSLLEAVPPESARPASE